MTELVPPGIEERPDVSTAALQALAGGFRYFNVAGSGPTFPVAQRAAECFRAWLNGVAMFSHVGYDAYNAALADTRADLAAFLGDAGGASRVALMQSATDGLNTLVAGLELPAGSTIVTTAEEHASALLPVYHRQKRGDRVVVLEHTDDDAFLDALGRQLARGARAVVMSLVSCRTGKVLPAAQAAALARSRGAVIVIDAAQAAGQIPVDVRAIAADAVVTLGHKWLHGPLATGAVWVAEPERFDANRLGWRSATRDNYGAEGAVGGYTLNPDATRFESGTVDVAAYVGLRQALAVQRALGAEVARRVIALRARLIARLRETPYRLVSRAEDPTGIVVVRPPADAAGIVSRMWADERIVVKLLTDPGHLECIRLSFWALHSADDIDALADALARQAATVAA